MSTDGGDCTPPEMEETLTFLTPRMSGLTAGELV